MEAAVSTSTAHVPVQQHQVLRAENTQMLGCIEVHHWNQQILRCNRAVVCNTTDSSEYFHIHNPSISRGYIAAGLGKRPVAESQKDKKAIAH